MKKTKEEINLKLESLDIKLLIEDTNHVYYRWYNYEHDIHCIMYIKIEDEQFGIGCYEILTNEALVLNNKIIELLQQIGYWKIKELQELKAKNPYKYYIENTELASKNKIEYLNVVLKDKNGE